MLAIYRSVCNKEHDCFGRDKYIKAGDLIPFRLTGG
jgi:hypothetical protein